MIRTKSVCVFSAIFSAFLLWSIALLAGTARAEKVDLYAVIVGISDYQDTKYTLRLAAKDAQDIAEFLKERRHQVGNLNTRLLVNMDATKTNIARALTDGLKEARKDDIVIIYLAGHGLADPQAPQNYYFLPHDFKRDDLAGSALLVNDPGLFKDIKSERVLLVADSCTSGGFLPGLARGVPTIPATYFPAFNNLYGRFGLSAAGPKEHAMELPKYGNGLFTFFFLKGLRGSAQTDERGCITVQSLYDFVASQTKAESGGGQNPQLYSVRGEAGKTPVYMVPVYSRGLNIDVKFFYEDEQHRVGPLTNDSVLKSGQHVGIAFKPAFDCYVHILWWDSSGQVGRLFPNPKLTEGTGFVKGGQVCWLPSKKEGRHWYVLDDKPGYETVYFVASRERNPKLEELYQQLMSLSSEAKGGARGAKVAEEIEREINLMGFADYTVPMKAQKVTYENKEKLFQELESKIKVAGVEAFLKLRFKHVAR